MGEVQNTESSHNQLIAREFLRLLQIMEDLRERCPWDKKQTFESLRYLTIEEVYELSEAILSRDEEAIANELGDLLLHIVFYAKLGSEAQAFDILKVLQKICEKLIKRHPHIYGEVSVENEEEVKRNWELIKQKEGQKRVLAGVPKGLPALIKAIRIQEKAKGVGFDFENVQQTWHKVTEEFEELQHASPENQFQEVGDLLFAIVNYARFIGVNPEDALEYANQKFIRRFHYIEQQIQNQQKSWQDFSLTQLDELWNEAKQTGL